MAWPQNLGTVIEWVVNWTLTGVGGDTRPIALVQKFFCSSPVTTPPNLVAFLVQVKSNMAGALTTWMPNACICTQASARWVNDGTSGVVFDPAPTAYSGAGGTGDWQPATVSAFLEKLSPWRYRGSRPGMHLGPVLEAFTTDYRLSLSGNTAATTVATDLAADVTGGGLGADVYKVCVFSQKASPPDPVTKAVIPMGAPVTSIRVRKTLGRMDRRGVRGVY